MLTTKEAIEKRRSIRKFKPDPILPVDLEAIMDAARLAPSGCNAQPWRFKIVTDSETKQQLAQIASNQSFIASAAAVVICCADVGGYLDGTVSGLQDLGKIGAIENDIVTVLKKKIEQGLETISIREIGPRIEANLAIAVEHIVLRALDFGIGSCWVKLFDEQKIKELFGWGDNLYVFTLLPMGYPAESPAPRKRLTLSEIMID